MTHVLILLNRYARGGSRISSQGRREHFWGISCEKSRFYAKKLYFFQFLGGRAPGATPESAPVRRHLFKLSKIVSDVLILLNRYTLICSYFEQHVTCSYFGEQIHRPLFKLSKILAHVHISKYYCINNKSSSPPPSPGMDNKIAGSVNVRSYVVNVESVYCRLLYEKILSAVSIRD